MSYFFRGRMLSLQMVDHLFIDVTLLKRPIVYLENGRPLQTTTAEGVDMKQLINDNSLEFQMINWLNQKYQLEFGIV